MANAYFTKVNKARKSDAKSFEYNGETYVQGKTKTGMVIYKKKAGSKKKPTTKMDAETKRKKVSNHSAFIFVIIFRIFGITFFMFQNMSFML